MTASDLLYNKGARSLILFNPMDITRCPDILNSFTASFRTYIRAASRQQRGGSGPLSPEGGAAGALMLGSFRQRRVMRNSGKPATHVSKAVFIYKQLLSG
jgi:hypothetical protein